MVSKVLTLCKPPNPVASLMAPLEAFELVSGDLQALIMPYYRSRDHQARRAFLATLDPVDLRIRVEEARAAIFAPTDEMQLRAAIGILLNLVPPPKADPKNFFEMCVHLLLVERTIEIAYGKRVDRVGFSAVVLAAIVRRAATTLKFAPTIAELLEIARNERRNMQTAICLADTVLSHHATYLAETEAP